jgi:hypothetical protein
MCLFSIKEERDEDIHVASRRVVRREERYREHSPRRSSRVSIRTSEPTIIIAPPAPLALQAPSGKVLPPPQPFPQFEVPPPPPPEVHYVHVSPRSSIDDDYHYERREVRYERDVSPRRSENYEFRYVDAPEEVRYRPQRERSRSRSRARSRSRVRHDDYDDYDDRGERRTNVRVQRQSYVDRDGHR